MPISTPTPDDVQKLFKKLTIEVTRGIETENSNEFVHHLGKRPNPYWQKLTSHHQSGLTTENDDQNAGRRLGPGTWHLPIDDCTSLISAAMTSFVIAHEAGQEMAIKQQIGALVDPLRQVVPADASVKLHFTFPSPEDLGPGIKVQCLVNGIVTSTGLHPKN